MAGQVHCTSLFLSLLSSSSCLLDSFEFLSTCPLAWLSSASMFCSYTAMINTATPTNDLSPHLSSAETVVRCYAPSLPCTPAESALLVATSSIVPVLAAPTVPDYPCIWQSSLLKFLNEEHAVILSTTTLIELCYYLLHKTNNHHWYHIL